MFRPPDMARQERDSLLTWLLVLTMAGAALLGLLSIASYIPAEDATHRNVPTSTGVELVLALIAFVGAYQVWYWRRWGVWLLYGAFLSQPLLWSRTGALESTTAVIVAAGACGLLYAATRGLGDPSPRRRRTRREEACQLCPECGDTNGGTALRCDCGYNFLKARREKECPKCRRFVPESANVCPCGRAFDA
jgi:hypothetical protein